PRAVRHRPRCAGPHPRLPGLRERDLRPSDPGDLRPARHRGGRRLSRRARDRTHHGSRRCPGASRARLDRRRPPAGASRMILAAILGIPLVGAALSWRASGRRATALHAVTAALTLAGALTVTVIVNRREPLLAFDGLLRADALSAWM